MTWTESELQALGECFMAGSSPPHGTELTCQVVSNPDRLPFNATRGSVAGALGISREALDDEGESAAGLALNELIHLTADERLPTVPEGQIPLLGVLTSTAWNWL